MSGVSCAFLFCLEAGMIGRRWNKEFKKLHYGDQLHERDQIGHWIPLPAPPLH
jgi:hypothetical protein